MRILKISGKNIASLAGEFCVDFEKKPLAQAGLFAISGPTGAGKSTLLDTLCLALYDATPRLPKTRSVSYLPDVGSETVGAHDSRTLLRRGASEAYAEVDFVGNDNQCYRARWQVRRARGKSGGALQGVQMSLHRLPELSALGGTKTEVLKEIAERVGLSFDQFTRAVLLAQNEFSAFLNTEENERGALLETLTGSAIYSVLSRRAHERFHAEKSAMQQLSARLADHTPLSGEARAALESQCAEADTALASADASKAALERHLRWHQEADKLRLNQSQAEAAVAQASAALEDARAQRRQLDTRDAVEAARPLQADLERLARETTQLEAAIGSASVALATALEQQQQAGAALLVAQQQLQVAEQAQVNAAPELDQARALDAGIAAVVPVHAKAAQMHTGAQLALQQAERVLQTKTAQLVTLQTDHGAAQSWLAQHKHLRVLAQQWPRWHTLLTQAQAAAAQQARARSELEAGSLTVLAEQQRERETNAVLTAATEQLNADLSARQLAAVALAEFDTEQLRNRREALELRREDVTKAEKQWAELANAQMRLAQLAQEITDLEAAHGTAAATLAAAQAASPPLAAALAQAERSLKAAELACADSVVDLRATLVDGAPCPVCGSAEHPYQHPNAGLDQMLESLRAEVATCRDQLQVNASTRATQQALLARHAQQIKLTQASSEALRSTCERLEQSWQALPMAGEAGPAPARAAWFAQQLEAMRDNSRALDVQERAARQAAMARDAAQQACERSTADSARAQEHVHAARAALAQAHARHAALLEKSGDTSAQLERLLAELDGAQAVTPEWRQQWQHDPARWHAALQAQAVQWQEQSTQHDNRGASISALTAELATHGERCEQLRQDASNASAELARIDADIQTRTAQRAVLWHGRPVREVEQGLLAAIANARTALERQQTAAHLAAQAETRARESQTQLEARVAQVREQALAAQQRLTVWLASYPQRHPLLDPVPDKAELDRLLALDGAELAAQRGALRAIDAAAASAHTVLAERRSQYDLHLQAIPDGAAIDAAQASANLAALEGGRQQTHEVATGLRLQLAQDNVRREHAQAMLAQIEKQQLIELRWGRMNELIGSADGKKFRNYAQQFTLDVLLGYANRHLGHLAKRYRLERVVAPSGPSLGLMVRDQDMGGEARSVNSLSGGESFLVSLALALGLASLSSNRVRVESLFIDEGFGSLDSETLRVALDALDGLQSMGRKVGVISHVQEMTERIATRIVVQPTGGGTSSVTVQ